MRGWTISLVLLFLTGTQARYFWQHDEPQSHAQHIREAIEGYIHKLRDIGKDAVSHVDTSDIGKQLDLKITEKYDTLSVNALSLRDHLRIYFDKVREQVATEIEKDVPLYREKVRPLVENFQRRWAEEVKSFREKVEPFGDELRKQTKDNIEGFYKNIQPLGEELRERLRAEVDSLRANLAPYSEDLRKHVAAKLEEAKANYASKAEEYRAQFAQHVEALKEKLAPVIENLKEQLLPRAEEAKAKLAKLLEAWKAKASESHA